MDILIVEVAAPHSTEPKPQEARDREDHGGGKYNASSKCLSGNPLDFGLDGIIKETI